jgi:hypothetical protein
MRLLIYILAVFAVFLFYTNSYGWSPFKKKKIESTEEKVEIVIKPCYYYLEHSNNLFVVFTVLQDKCSGVVLSGIMNGRTIIEYNDELKAISEQKIADDDTFREKINALWPNIQEIKFKP